MISWRRLRSIRLVSAHSPGCSAESMAFLRKQGTDRILWLSRAILSTLPEVRGWESQTNRPCVFPPCLYAVPRPGLLPTSPPLPLQNAKARRRRKKDKSEQPPPPLPSPPTPPQLPLHPPVSLFLSSERWQTQKEAERQSRGACPPERAQIRPRGWWRRPGRGEGWGGEDLRRGVGVAVISRARLRGLCHRADASWDEEWHPSLFSLLVFSPSLVFSMRALYGLEEGYEVPFGCHWHVKRVWRWQLTRSAACN